MKFLGEPAVGVRLIDRIEVLALDVFDERHLEQRSFLPGDDLADDDRHAQEAGLLRSAPTTLAGDDVKAITASPHHNWLNDAVRLNRSRHIIQPRLVHLSSRL